MSNNNTGHGSARSKIEGVEVNIAPRILTSEERLGLFRSNKIVEKLVLLPCEAASKHWGTFSFGHTEGEDSSDLVSAMDEYCSNLGVIEAFTEASVEGRLNGDGWIVLDLQDGREINEPVDRDNIKSVAWLEVLERDMLQPNTSGSIVNPKDYRFNINQDVSDEFKSLNTQIIHSDRVLRFPGKRLMARGLRYNGGYNDSAIQACFSELSTYLQSYYSVGGMLADYSVFTYGLKGLATLAQSGDTSALVNRFVAIQMGISSLKGVMHDSESETVSYLNRSFGGIDPVLQRMEDFLLTATGFPKSKLLGHSGQNALSEGGKTDERLWSEFVANFQNTIWTAPRRRLGEYVLLSKDGPTGGTIPKGFGFTWESALQLTGKEQAEIEKLFAETDKIRIESGSMHPSESRQRLNGYKFNQQITLRDDFTEALEAVIEADTDSMEDGTTPEVKEPEPKEKTKPREDWDSKFNLDDLTKAKKVIKWQGLSIGLQYLPFDTRHGKTLTAGYGYIQNTKGADGMALDCYVGTKLDSPKLFVVEQVINGEFDEYKFILGVTSLKEAKATYLGAMPSEFMKSIKEIKLSELKSFDVAKRSDEWVELRLDGSVSDPIELDSRVSDRKYIPLERAAELSQSELKQLAKLEYK
ncbi:MAG: DUF1073 domain-containing protein [Nodosilinea sp. WJT8-NPBG4]|nr:DUF1073 domain-containing protein [Nodosilinea sp. WJT8-NPBG4]